MPLPWNTNRQTAPCVLTPTLLQEMALSDLVNHFYKEGNVMEFIGLHDIPYIFLSPTNLHTFPLQSSSHHQTGFVTFPHLPPTPHSLRQNTVSVSFFFLLFPFCPILALYVFSFRFHSYCAIALQHCSNIPFLFLPILSLLIGQHFSLVTISLSDDSVFPYSTWSVCCPCTVYKPASFVSPLLS